MFDALEAINDIIDDINTENGETCYEAICDELDTRVENGDLTLEDAQVIADRAAEEYLEHLSDIRRQISQELVAQKERSRLGQKKRPTYPEEQWDYDHVNDKSTAAKIKMVNEPNKVSMNHKCAADKINNVKNVRNYKQLNIDDMHRKVVKNNPAYANSMKKNKEYLHAYKKVREKQQQG